MGGTNTALHQADPLANTNATSYLVLESSDNDNLQSSMSLDDLVSHVSWLWDLVRSDPGQVNEVPTRWKWMTQEKFQLKLWLLLLIGQLLCNWTLEQFDWLSKIQDDHGAQTNLRNMKHDEMKKVGWLFWIITVFNLARQQSQITGWVARACCRGPGPCRLQMLQLTLTISHSDTRVSIPGQCHKLPAPT